jgi:hypothetical protein
VAQASGIDLTQPLSTADVHAINCGDERVRRARLARTTADCATADQVRDVVRADSTSA